MNNASIYFVADGYDTTGDRLMGRHAAGESFLRGFLRHAEVDRFHFFNASAKSNAELERLIQRIEPPTRELTWVNRRARQQLSDPGCLYYPAPHLSPEAWSRRPFDSRRYSLTGVTHTTATHRAMDAIAELLIAPIEPWDALICTSSAVRRSVEVQLEAAADDLKVRLGATRLSQIRLETIPLGVNVDDFTPDPAHRQAWRERLDIPQDALVALYVGRFSAFAKMNPVLMAMALEATAQATGREIYWIVSGWGGPAAATENHHRHTQTFCPSIHYRPVDGRPAETRFSIWSAADLFISFSENIQETFGLTPVEAMAAGLPCVVTDWDGYRDTVRDGVDGYSIRTFMPRPGLGRDLAFAHANDWIPYEQYLSAAAQVTAIDLAAATEALSALVVNPHLRARMGAAGRQRAREVFDWSAIVPQYQALWGELAARRKAAPAPPVPAGALPDNPRRLDPFQLFAGYPSEAVTAATVAFVVPGMTWDLARARLGTPFTGLSKWALPFPQEQEQMFEFFAARGQATVGEMLAEFAANRRPFLERGVLWLVKFGVLALAPDGPFLPRR